MARESALAEAMYLPQSDAGVALRKSFIHFADWRTIDLVRIDLRRGPPPVEYEDGMAVDRPWETIDEEFDRRKARERAAGGNRAKLDCLIMHDMGFAQAEIAAKTGACAKTQKRWRDGYDLLKKEWGIG